MTTNRYDVYRKTERFRKALTAEDHPILKALFEVRADCSRGPVGEVVDCVREGLRPPHR